MKLWILAGFVYVPSQQAQDCPVEISYMLVFVLAGMDCFLFLFSQVMSLEDFIWQRTPLYTTNQM